ncbi:MAG TPA: PASTA domain-containing protein, partial [Gemmatimonadaceae bacterium]|nr:PASTA domain-containing protein [Gemmatimonadaceae bacterium]
QAVPVEQNARTSPPAVTTDTAADDASVPIVVTLPMPASAPAPRTMHPVPDIRGLPLRDAVRSLHNAGFRVQLARAAGGGSATSPSAGELAPTGTLVRLLFDY